MQIPVLIEFHDARLESLELLPNGTLIFRWSHVVAFFEKGKDLFDVCSCSAKLFLYGVSAVHVAGIIAIDDVVMDASWQRDGTEVDPTLMLRPMAAQRGKIMFQSGSAIELAFGSAHLQEVVLLEILEQWVGPLQDPAVNG